MIYNFPASTIKQNFKTVTFTGAAGAGAVGTVTIFTVTGRIYVHRLTAFCTTLLTEAGATATISLGVTGSTSFFIANTNAVDIDANEWWFDTTPDAAGFDISSSAGMFSSVINANVIATVGTQAVNAGVIVFEMLWEPILPGSTVA